MPAPFSTCLPLYGKNCEKGEKPTRGMSKGGWRGKGNNQDPIKGETTSLQYNQREKRRSLDQENIGIPGVVLREKGGNLHYRGGSERNTIKAQHGNN